MIRARDKGPPSGSVQANGSRTQHQTEEAGQDVAPDAARAAAHRASVRAPTRHRGKRSGDAQATVTATLTTFNNLPSYLQANEFIHTRYRAPTTVKNALRSIVGIHTETVNIWSHLLGFLMFIWLTCVIVITPPAPLALSTHQLEQLWGSTATSVREDIHPLHATSVQEDIHLLHPHQRPEQLWGSTPTSVREDVHLLHPHHQPEQTWGSVRGVFSYPTPRWPAYVFCVGALICLFCSSMYHLLGCCQRHITQRMRRVDHTGISVLIVTSFYPAVYYGLMCAPIWRTFYLAAVSAMGVGTVAVSLIPHFQSVAWRPVRAGLFAALGLFGTVPILHGCYLNGMHVWAVRAAAVGDAIMGATYLVGALIYAKRVPERWFPGRFDILFSSHQIFHVAVVIAAYIHWRVVCMLMEWRDASGGCAAVVIGVL